MLASETVPKPKKPRVLAWYAIHTVWLSGMVSRLELPAEWCTESAQSFLSFFLFISQTFNLLLWLLDAFLVERVSGTFSWSMCHVE